MRTRLDHSSRTRQRCGRSCDSGGSRIEGAYSNPKSATRFIAKKATTTYFPQGVPHETRFWSCEQRTLATLFLPHAHAFSIRNGQGGHAGSSWHACGI